MPKKIDSSTIREIKKLYIEEEKTIKEIAKKLSIHEQTVGSYLKGTKKKIYTGREPGNKSKIDKEDLKEIYEKTKSSRKTAEIFGVSKTTILNFLREYTIPILKEPVRGREPSNKVKINKNDLKEIYEKTKSSRKTAEIFGVSKATILRALREQDIPIMKESIRGREPINKVKIPKNDLESMYNETKSADKTAQIFGISKTAILNKLKQYHIPVNTPGGKRYEPNSKRYAKQYRKEIIVNGRTKKMHRYIMEKELGRELKSEETVHHIDMDASNNIIENLCLFASKSEHTIAHHSAWKLMRELLKTNIIGFKQGRYYIIKS